MKDYRSFNVTKVHHVATIRMLPLRETLTQNPPSDIHVELPGALEELRADNTIRIIILTGANNGVFQVPPPSEYYTSPLAIDRLGDPYGMWDVATGVIRCCQAMTEIEKPIIAKVNGDAIGFGQSLMLACDLIIAREDAKIADAHLGMSEVVTSEGQKVGLPFGTVPGDGAGALIPLFMTPTKAKEYMMLSLTYTAAELAEMGIINRAVPMAELDATTDNIVERLLKRSAFALSWTKRIMNRHVAQQANLTLDTAIAYEALNFSQIQRLGFQNDPTSLQRPDKDVTK
jgi:enoyl-CoA hydratase